MKMTERVVADKKRDNSNASETVFGGMDLNI